MVSEKNISKQIRILTIHFGTNHGSVLQSYALSEYLNSLGHDAKIIDYVPERYKIWNSLLLKKRSKYPLPVILAYYPLALLKSMRVRRLFERFLNKNLRLTERYSTSSELKLNPPKADVYITGSDQVWNNDYNGNDDFSYFLDFADDSSKRVAYAASFGKESINEQEYIQKAKTLLKSFDDISVRETDACNLLNEWGFESAHVVDPVFLLTKEQWESFGNFFEIRRPYILVYVMDGLYSELLDYAEKLKKKTGNDIFVVSFKKIKDPRIDKCFHLADPKDFIGLIRNADMVVTNSFHGTAFSVLFERKFISVGKEKYNSRMLSLLEKLDLKSHFVGCNSGLSAEEIQEIIMYKDINRVADKLGKWAMESKEFIDKSLNTEQNRLNML